MDYTHFRLEWNKGMDDRKRTTHNPEVHSDDLNSSDEEFLDAKESVKQESVVKVSESDMAKVGDSDTDVNQGSSLVDSEGFLKSSDTKSPPINVNQTDGATIVPSDVTTPVPSDVTTPVPSDVTTPVPSDVTSDHGDRVNSEGAQLKEGSASRDLDFNEQSEQLDSPVPPTETSAQDVVNEALNDEEKSEEEQATEPEPQMTDIDEEGLKERDAALADEEKEVSQIFSLNVMLCLLINVESLYSRHYSQILHDYVFLVISRYSTDFEREREPGV